MSEHKVQFPPYGTINDHFLDALREHSNWPTSWMSPEGDQRPISEQWARWKEKTLDIIADVLWPRFDPICGWQGRSVDTMEALTRIDLGLCRKLHSMLEQN